MIGSSPSPLPVSLWRDDCSLSRDGAGHMALDEALLGAAADAEPARTLLRFYRWRRPEITIGVFVPHSAMADRSEPVTRRWTGGGIVEHGNDLTFSLAVPPAGVVSAQGAADLYRWIHEALAAALRAEGCTDAIAAPLAPVAKNSEPGFCFAAPVAWDVMDRQSGTKIAGGAQRRSRAGLLHQGSVRLPAPWSNLDHPWIDRFAENLATGAGTPPFSPSPELFAAADRLRASRYAHPDWLARH